jgi:O-antigen/teichoic acid export membrane protein
MTTRLRNAVTLVAIGTVCWVVAGVIALASNADAKVIWTCISGAILGLIGIRYTIRRERRSGL